VRKKYCWTGWSWNWWLEWCERKILLDWSWNWLPNAVIFPFRREHENIRAAADVLSRVAVSACYFPSRNTKEIKGWLLLPLNASDSDHIISK